MNRFSITAGLLSATLLLAGCDRSEPQATENGAPAFTVNGNHIDVGPQSPLRRELRVGQVVTHSAAASVVLPAAVEIDPSHSVAIVAPAVGRVIRVDVALGQHVRKNETLLVMASGDIAQARSDQDKAHDAEEVARRAMTRAQSVHDAGGAATKDLEAAKSALVQAAAERTRADSHMEVLAGAAPSAINGMTVQIRAPMSGVVTALTAAPGALINDTTSALVTVTNLDRVWVTAGVPELERTWITPGSLSDVTFPALPGVVLHGKVESIDPMLDSDTRRIKAHVIVANGDGRLLPNMFGLAVFPAPHAGQLEVPQSALVMNNDRISVFVQRAPWSFQRRDVAIGREVGQDVEIESGLSAGEVVVTRGGVLLQ
jgi:cobalt-zinc-cadmium efflux system membrane fusion protein